MCTKSSSATAAAGGGGGTSASMAAGSSSTGPGNQKVLTVFNIGSGHTSMEEYNLLVCLFKATIADFEARVVAGRLMYFLPSEDSGMPPHMNGLERDARTVKMINNGPNASDTTISAGHPTIMQTVSNVLKVIYEFQPDIVNMVGHSRGAIGCLITSSKASQAAQSPQSAQAAQSSQGDQDVQEKKLSSIKFNLAIIDPVRDHRLNPFGSVSTSPYAKQAASETVADLRLAEEPQEGAAASGASDGTGESIPLDLIQVPDNVKCYVRFTMEDTDANASTRNFFLLNIFSVDASAARQNFPLPGTHGTAVQCNPIAANGSNVPITTPLGTSGFNSKIWPIGKVAFGIISELLERWGTHLIQGVRFRNEEILEAYALVLNENKLEFRGAHYWRYVNDIDLHKANQPQKLNLIKLPNNLDDLGNPTRNLGAGFGGYSQAARTPEELGRICPNKYRFSRLFVNDDHHDRFQAFFPNLTRIVDGIAIGTLRANVSFSCAANEFRASTIAEINSGPYHGQGFLLEIFKMYASFPVTLSVIRNVLIEDFDRRDPQLVRRSIAEAIVAMAPADKERCWKNVVGVLPASADDLYAC